jgi:hypothetical protein
VNHIPYSIFHLPFVIAGTGFFNDKWNMEYGIWNMEYGIWNMEYGI